MAEVQFPITGNPEDDQVLIESPLALTIGMLLDQQVPMSWAFRGPARLKERLGGRLADRIICAGALVDAHRRMGATLSLGGSRRARLFSFSCVAGVS